MAWYDRYKDSGIYKKSDQPSTKAAKTKRFINQQVAIGSEKTSQRLNNARKKNEGWATENKEADQNTRKRVEKIFNNKRANWH